MFDHLKKYKNNNYFTLTIEDLLAEVCNAPIDKSGVYIVYLIKNSIENVIYIGSSGKMQKDGSLKTRTGGMRDRLVNGKDSNGVPRRKSWIIRMKNEGISKLVVRWWVTFDAENKHIPAYIEGALIQEYFEKYHKLPAWNNEF